MKSNIKHIILGYLIICYVAAIILELGFGSRSKGDHFVNEIILYLPGLTVALLYLLILRKPFFKSKDLGLSLRGWKYWILAPLVITAMCLISYGISVWLNPGLLKSREEIIFALKESGFFFGHIGLGLIAVTLINALLGTLVSIPLYLGQELGWRAFMLPRLLKVLMPVPTFILGGMLWGLWSLIFLAPLFSGSGNPLVECLLTIMFCIPLGIIFQFLFFKTRSIFVAVLAHGALYKSLDTASLILSQDEMSALAFGPMGFSGVLIFWAMALFLFNKINWQLNNTYHE